MAARSSLRLQRALNKASGRNKGLLAANAKAHLNVHGTNLITMDEVQNLRQSVASEEERRSYNTMLDIEDVISFHISNTRVSYLRLREQLSHLHGLFLLFKQHVFFEEYLNLVERLKLSRGAMSDKQALYELGGVGWPCLFGVVGLRNEDGRSFVDITVAEQGKTLARHLISSATELMTSVKTSIEAAREFMETNDVHLTAFEYQMSTWEQELRELVRSVKFPLLPDDVERGEEVRDFYSQSREKLLEFVEALPEYESVSVDEGSLDELLELMMRHLEYLVKAY
jgi:hypothetical protein